MEIPINATLRIEVLHLIETVKFLNGLKQIVFGPDVRQRPHSIVVELLPQDDIRVLEDLHQVGGHFWVVLPHPHELLLDQIDVLLDEVLVVFKAFRLVVGGGFDDVLAMALFLSLDETQGVTGLEWESTCCPYGIASS